MKLLILSILIFPWAVNAQQISSDFFFLEGLWKLPNRENFEQWRISGDTLSGVVFEVNGGKRVVSENMQIYKEDGIVSLYANVQGQNEGITIAFALQHVDQGRYIFENSRHDFPKKIIYKDISPDTLGVEVRGEDDKGFSYQMIRQSAPSLIPSWFLSNMEDHIGHWITDNSQYQSDQEVYDHYGMTWEWGIGNTSTVGRLYAFKDEEQSQDFWQFRQYWDNMDREGKLQQFGHGGVNGLGTVSRNKDGNFESIQVFSLPDGRNWVEKHITIFGAEGFTTTSYEQNEDGSWTKKRTYYWTKRE
ncbi:DUF6265 family protein [Portibacter marinus]|uniref:DUF6265 family protein n=1 Tax=Portibacter marinus TaxID=2898660 RepID=UPI001F387029|nr:DUF6265 family protein [Portibacter marinus]